MLSTWRVSLPNTECQNSLSHPSCHKKTLDHVSLPMEAEPMLSVHCAETTPDQRLPMKMLSQRERSWTTKMYCSLLALEPTNTSHFLLELRYIILPCGNPVCEEGTFLPSPKNPHFLRVCDDWKIQFHCLLSTNYSFERVEDVEEITLHSGGPMFHEVKEFVPSCLNTFSLSVCEHIMGYGWMCHNTWERSESSSVKFVLSNHHPWVMTSNLYFYDGRAIAFSHRVIPLSQH